MTHSRSRTLKRCVPLVVVAMALVFAAAPAGAAPSGTVDATVDVEGPCITVPISPLSFGAVGFSLVDSNTEAITLSGATVTSCTAQALELYASASDAVGSGTGSWTVGYGGSDLICSLGPDQFGAGIRESSQSVPTWLGSADTLVGDLIGHYNFYAHLMMPCSGSSGVGETMTFTYTFTGVLP